MLIGFRVQNFRTFNDEISLSFIASSDRSLHSAHCSRTSLNAAPHLTRLAAIFGPNGSGKTNLILALRMMREIVLHSATYTAADLSQRYSPFLFGASQTNPTAFAIDVLIESVRYQYSFAYHSSRIVAERLLVYRSSKAQRWFARSWDGQRESWQSFAQNFSGPRAMWRKATRSSALFLTTASQLNCSLLQPLRRWFERELLILVGSELPNLKAQLPKLVDPFVKSNLLTVLNAVGFKLRDLRAIDDSPGQLKSGTKACATMPVDREASGPLLEFLHCRNGTSLGWMQPDRESTGLLRLIAILVPLLDALHAGRFIAIDEFGRGLHPLVSRCLMGLAVDSLASANSQVMFNTHDATLMDLKFLRRDEMWMLELDHQRASTLSSLADHSIRKTASVLKHYLCGRYGATPHIGSSRG